MVDEMHFLNETKDTVFLRFLIRNRKPFIKYNGWSIYNFNKISSNPANCLRFQRLRQRIFNKYALIHTAPIDNACNFLISSNILYRNLNQISDIPCTTLSSFACELFLKVWISEDRVKYIPIKNSESQWVIHLGSDSFNELKLKIKNNSDRHNLLKIFNILPKEIKFFYQLVYKYYYQEELQESLDASLNIISDYFFKARYSHEDIHQKYNVHLANTLANFFYDAIVILLNPNGEVITSYE